MTTLPSAVTRDAVFEQRRGRMESLVAELRERSELFARGGGAVAVFPPNSTFVVNRMTSSFPLRNIVGHV